MSTTIGESRFLSQQTGQEQDPLSAFVLRFHQLPDHLHGRAKAGWFQLLPPPSRYTSIYELICWLAAHFEAWILSEQGNAHLTCFFIPLASVRDSEQVWSTHFAGAAGEKLSLPWLCYAGVQPDNLFKHRGTGQQYLQAFRDVRNICWEWLFRKLTLICICNRSTWKHGCSSMSRSSRHHPDTILDFVLSRRKGELVKSVYDTPIAIQECSRLIVHLFDFHAHFYRAVAKRSIEPNSLAFLKDGHLDRYC